MVNFLILCFTFVRQNPVPWRWSCDEIFWNAEASQVEQIFDHLSLDVTIQLRGRVKTAEENNIKFIDGTVEVNQIQMSVL